MKKLFMILVLLFGFAGWSSSVGASSVHSVEGTVVDAAMNTVVLKATTGKIYTFITTDVDKSKFNGLVIGDRFRIYYKGDLNKVGSERVQVISMVKLFAVYDIKGTSKYITGSKWANMKKMRDQVKRYALANKGVVYLNDQPESRRVYLTFDDGPDGVVTSKIIDILAANHVKGNFFFIGKNAEKYPSVVKKAVRNGECVGTHGYNHVDLTTLSKIALNQQFDKGNASIKKITGVKPVFIRPPFGAINSNVISAAKAHHEKMIIWSIDTLDWSQKDAAHIVKNVMDNVRPGDIILMHSDGDKSATVKALPILIQKLKALGYTFGTLDQLQSL